MFCEGCRVRLGSLKVDLIGFQGSSLGIQAAGITVSGLENPSRLGWVSLSEVVQKVHYNY